MISKRVNAIAPTLERSPRFARLRSCLYKYKSQANNLFLKQKRLGRGYMPELMRSEV